MLMASKRNELQDFVRVVAESPQRISKYQGQCGARRYFADLEDQKDYFKTITEDQLEKIPTPILLWLPPSKVMDLPDSVCPTFLDKMEDANLSFIPPRSWSLPALTNRALSCLTNERDVVELTEGDLSSLGDLKCQLPPSKLRLLAPHVLDATLENMAACRHIPLRHTADLIQLVRDIYGDVSQWEAETMERFGCLVFLDDEAVAALPIQPWMKDIFYFLMSRMSRRSKAMRKKWFELVTTNPLNGTVEQNITKSNSSMEIMTPNEAVIDELGESNCYWSPAQLEKMPIETFMEKAEILGACSYYDAEQLAVLLKKATEAFGPVSQLAACQLVELGCITQSFSDSELEYLPFSMDTLEQLAHCGWTELQMMWVWKGVSKRSNLKAQLLNAADMVTLNRFICGLNSSEIQLLNLDNLMDAVGSMRGVWCTLEKMRELKKHAVTAYGPPSTWSEALATDLGAIVCALDGVELASLKLSVLPFISEWCVRLISQASLKALSDDQLRAFGPDIAAKVTSDQRAQLSVSQRAALEEAETGARNQTLPPEQSGAPSLSVEGISAFLKPLLFLFMGFLLL